MTVSELLDRVVTLVPAAIRVPTDHVRGEPVVCVDRASVLDALRTLRDDPDTRFDMLSDLTVVDYLGRTPRFEVVYQLYSLGRNHRLRVKVAVGEDDPAVPSVSGLWKSALWAEREAWDMFGIRFTGHPDLRRILMYPEFEGHPLRKDYPLLRRQPLVPERDPIADPWYPRNGAPR
jgi:NADH-quinone oxidoreductase subunit C